MEDKKELCNKDTNIVFFDVDFTLYTPKTGVPASAAEAIRKLRENGHKAFICTGRTKAMVFESILNVGFDGIVSGAGTYAECDGNIIFRRDLDEDVIANVIETLRSCKFIPVPEGHDYMYFESKDKWSDRYNELYNSYCGKIGDAIREIPDDLKGIKAAKLSAIFTDDSDVSRIEELLGDRFIVVNHNNYLLELVPRGYSKAEGIKKVIESLNIPWENTYAFGDSMNDYEMLCYVKNSIAMGNSVEGIKNVVGYITETVENDGIYKGLEHFGLI